MRYNLLKGTVPLFIAFWVFGIIPWIIYGLIGMLFTKYYLQISLVPLIQFVFYLYLLLPFLYFPLIYVSIWNASTYYSKNRLWPILAKISVILGFAFLLVGAVVIINNLIRSTDINYQIDKEVKLLNQSLPMKANDMTDIVNVTFKNNVITYHYRLINKEKSEINSTFFALVMKPNLVQLVCKNKALVNYLATGITMSYHYVDKNNAEICSIFIKATDCK